jgi:hypothetical protein
MIARQVHSLTQTKQKSKVMIARKVHSLTKQKSHDCTKSSFIDKNTKKS